MKIVIDISENDYELIKVSVNKTSSDYRILEGTILSNALEDRHPGHWIKTISENGVTSAARCSECGFGDNRYMLFRYCPNCGSDMGEAEND